LELLFQKTNQLIVDFQLVVNVSLTPL